MSSATLDNPASPARAADPSSTQDADELLSRLAGEEIDRLVESEGLSNDKGETVPELEPSVVDSELAAHAEAALPQTQEPHGTETSVADALNAEVLDAVLKDVPPADPDPLATPVAERLSPQDHPEPQPAAPTPDPAPDPAEPPPAESDAAGIEAAATTQSPAEQPAATGELPSAPPDTTTSPAAAAPATSAGAAPADAAAADASGNAPPLLDTPAAAPVKKKINHLGPPFLTAQDLWKPAIPTNVLADLPDLMPDWQARLLAPLLFLNRPFEHLSPQTRSLLGLLALLTLFNSAVIIVWALFFKH